MTIADTPPIRAVLGSQGAGVVCVDYLGYGLSEGEPTEGYRAAHAALSLIEERFGVVPGSVDVVGWSLASAVSLFLASHRPVRRLVLMSPFAGANRVNHVTCPTLLITGDADQLTPPWMAQDLASGLPGRPEVVLVPGAGHNDLSSQPVVWHRILDFLGASAGRRAGTQAGLP